MRNDWHSSPPLGVVFLSLAAPKALATDYAIGSDAESINVDQAIHPGQTVTLPVFGIYNKGTKPANYEMAVVAVGKDDGLDTSWVAVRPAHLQPRPGRSHKIKVTVLRFL